MNIPAPNLCFGSAQKAEPKQRTSQNMSGFVKTMFDAVTRGRKNKRTLPNSESEIKVLKDMKSLESFFATI